MTNQLIPLTSDEPKFSRPRQATSFLKIVVFSMGNLNLALRIDAVYKVVNHTSTYGSGIRSVGVTHLGESEITVVDLHQQFFKASQGDSSNLNDYLIVVQNATGELYGIPVAETPSLMEVPLSMIRILPESYRRADTLDIANHVAVIPQESGTLTVFLLDVDRLLPLFQELAVE
jgi:purine-binding chemotaxis protein CheW